MRLFLFLSLTAAGFDFFDIVQEVLDATPLAPLVDGSLDPTCRDSVWRKPENYKVTNGYFDPFYRDNVLFNNPEQALADAALVVLEPAKTVAAVWNAFQTPEKHEITPENEREQTIRNMVNHGITRGVNHDALRRALSTYPQKEAWTCGCHATGRARIILGKMNPADLPNWVHNCPRSVDLGISGTQVGALPADLSNYAGSSQRVFDCQNLVNIVASGKPVVVLVKSGGINLHYHTAVGVNEDGTRIAILETNNVIYTYDRGAYCKTTDTWLGDAMLTF